MEAITNFIASTNDTKIIKQIGNECKEHLNYLQHMSKSTKEPSIQHIVEQIHKCHNVDEMKTLIEQCNTTIKNIEDEYNRVKQERYSQQILEFLQNHINDALLATFKLCYASFHPRQSDDNESYDISFSLNGVRMWFNTEREENICDIDMRIGEANGEINFEDFKFFECNNISNADMKHLKKYAGDANVTVENYLSLIYKIWNVMTEEQCFRDICRTIQYDREHGRGFMPTNSARSSPMSY